MRDLFIGYFCVFISYMLIGCAGYIGFMGTNFTHFFATREGTHLAGQIHQNCTNMYEYSSMSAFLLRLAIFLQIFTTYPLVNYFTYSTALKLFWRNSKPSASHELALNLVPTIVPLMVALFYPNVGTLLSYTGSISCFFILYLLPVATHLKRLRLRMTSPLVAEALDKSLDSQNTVE